MNCKKAKPKKENKSLKGVNNDSELAQHILKL